MNIHWSFQLFILNSSRVNYISPVALSNDWLTDGRTEKWIIEQLRLKNVRFKMCIRLNMRKENDLKIMQKNEIEI